MSRAAKQESLTARYRARSLWLDTIPDPLAPRPSLAGDLDCDVAIVGAGFTGLWTAYYLKQHQPMLDVVVVEREIAGYGPSGRNGGWAMSGLIGSASVYARARGADSVRRAVSETRSTVDEIGRVVAQEQIECGYRKSGSLIVATTQPQRTRLLEGLREAFDPDDTGEKVEAGELEGLVRIPGVLTSAYSPHAARIDPARLVRGLADACERLGVRIFERTEALALQGGQIRCATGNIRAETILRATEAYTIELPGESRRYLPLYTLMIATEPLPTEVWDELGWRDGLLIGDARHLFFYAQRTMDGRIAIGGRGAPYQLFNPIDELHERSGGIADRLVRALRSHFPAAAEAKITHHWGGPLAVSRDWSMTVSFDVRSRIGWAGGYSGHGVVGSNISGRTLADLVLGRDSDLVTLPWAEHVCRRWEPEPLRFLASRAIMHVLGRADQLEDHSGRPSKRTRLVAPFMPR